MYCGGYSLTNAHVCDCSQGVSRFLDRAGAADRAAIKAHAQQAQYDEYDDEYDDSYDDLGGPAADGVADVEGDTLSCHVGACCDCTIVSISMDI